MSGWPPLPPSSGDPKSHVAVVAFDSLRVCLCLQIAATECGARTVACAICESRFALHAGCEARAADLQSAKAGSCQHRRTGCKQSERLREDILTQGAYPVAIYHHPLLRRSAAAARQLATSLVRF